MLKTFSKELIHKNLKEDLLANFIIVFRQEACYLFTWFKNVDGYHMRAY